MPRRWFLESNTEGLGTVDLAILNRAARHLVDQGNQPTHRLLMEIRLAYKFGMSSQEVIDSVNNSHFGIKE